MGQKVIPTSLRLNKNENWNSQWIANKQEYPNLLHFDFEIYNYFNTVCNYKISKLMKLNIVKKSKNINIYVYIKQHPKFKLNLPYSKIIFNLNLYYKNNNVKLFIKNVQLKDLKKLKNVMKKMFFLLRKKHWITKNTRQIIYILSFALYTKNIHMITNMIKQNLQKRKAHKKKIRIINNLFKSFFNLFFNFIGYRLQFKGRLNGSKRKRKLMYQKGKIPLNTLQYDIQYSFNEFLTPSGICSIKLWIFLKKEN